MPEPINGGAEGVSQHFIYVLRKENGGVIQDDIKARSEEEARLKIANRHEAPFSIEAVQPVTSRFLFTEDKLFNPRRK